MSLLEESYEAPPPQQLPAAPPALIQTFSQRRQIGGRATELLVQTFDDRILVIVTQSGKVGCLTQASLPPVHQLLPPPSSCPSDAPLAALPPPPASISLTPLLGSPPDAALHDLYVSQIATLVWWALQLAHVPRRPVVIGLALKLVGEGVTEQERGRFSGVMDMVASWPGPQ
ncbi:hypothetical protein CC85DRAFT_299072 [Cutaneotrichosporon oleaginosum]|uniref:Proteasome assembly chaperone 3 n=1 Tax=Cutaneotrichosporon oleaginosum TaxID=879819 RepID=A0A0J1BCW9_9TREE|nr:uncharacterized protein CC85DRAFT_299072 [Cutaneotrichosporon oleaginosum]KLT45889.1 hypothetical protein CC85DRAFT_299072 [Cutaneotrichosporon oleaginosum]TXT06590.1 hypothetical protein COLE_05921 [Cutaneotrichosporon oleaginosum]